MALDPNIIEKTAGLANLNLSEEEKTEYGKQLSDILDYAAAINEIDTDGIEPTDHIAEIKNVFREDTAKESIPREAIESIAPEFENGHITVPKIIET